jgi:hypothetical protein
MVTSCLLYQYLAAEANRYLLSPTSRGEKVTKQGKISAGSEESIILQAGKIQAATAGVDLGYFFPKVSCEKRSHKTRTY